MTNIEREKIAERTRKSESLRAVWLRERQIVLSEQLAANDEVKKRWTLSDPIEVKQREAATGKRRG